MYKIDWDEIKNCISNAEKTVDYAYLTSLFETEEIYAHGKYTSTPLSSDSEFILKCVYWDETEETFFVSEFDEPMSDYEDKRFKLI